MQRRADGPLLDRRIHDLVALAEFRHQFLRLRRIPSNRREQILGPAQEIIDASEARRDHGCGRHAVAGTHAAEVEGLLHMVAVALPVGHARGLLGREGERVAHLSGIEPQHRSRRRGRPERG